MGKKLGLDAAYANLGKGYLQHPVINSVKPKPTRVRTFISEY